MVIYTVLAKKIEKIKKKSKKLKKSKKIKNARNNFWGPCQVLNIYRYFPQNKMNLFILSGHAGDSFAAFLNEVIL